MGLLPYQQLIRDASPSRAAVFRELQEGLLEAERIRAQTGHWPDVATLAGRRDSAVRAAIRRRRSRTSGPRCARTGRRITSVCRRIRRQPAWVLVILEPEPGAPPDPAPNDETHHRLPDGTTLHVSIWNMPEDKRRSGFAALRLPQNDGWTNWLVGSNAQ